MKIVINNQYGGFDISTEATREYLKLKGKEAYFYEIEVKDKQVQCKKINDSNSIFTYCFTKDFGEKFISTDLTNEEWDKYSFNSNNIERTDKDLIKVIEKLGEKVNTTYSTLKIVEIPDDVEWTIEEYDGNEWIAEKHRTWN